MAHAVNPRGDLVGIGKKGLETMLAEISKGRSAAQSPVSDHDLAKLLVQLDTYGIKDKDVNPLFDYVLGKSGSGGASVPEEALEALGKKLIATQKFNRNFPPRKLERSASSGDLTSPTPQTPRPSNARITRAASFSGGFSSLPVEGQIPSSPSLNTPLQVSPPRSPSPQKKKSKASGPYVYLYQLAPQDISQKVQKQGDGSYLVTLSDGEKVSVSHQLAQKVFDQLEDGHKDEAGSEHLELYAYLAAQAATDRAFTGDSGIQDKLDSVKDKMGTPYKAALSKKRDDFVGQLPFRSTAG